VLTYSRSREPEIVPEQAIPGIIVGMKNRLDAVNKIEKTGGLHLELC
jgi:hypothetical protein